MEATQEAKTPHDTLVDKMVWIVLALSVEKTPLLLFAMHGVTMVNPLLSMVRFANHCISILCPLHLWFEFFD